MRDLKKWYIITWVLVLGLVPETLADTGNAKYLFGIMTGEIPNAYFGSAIVGGVDWAGSGTKYLAISAPGAALGPVREGTVYFYDSLGAETPAMVMTGASEGDLFGYRLSGRSDINGDKIPDLAVAAPYGRAGTQKPGKVYLFFGGDEFTKSKPIELSADEQGDGFGLAVCLEEDLNGDGLADLVVGAPYSNRAGPLAGRAYIWWGGDKLKSKAKPDVVLRHGTTNDMYGTSLAIGDINGDGQADLVIGAPQHNVGDKIPGSVFVYFGGKNANWQQPSLVLNGEAKAFYDHFGAVVAIPGDVNGDGADDLLVGAPKVKISGGDQGRVYLFSGGKALDENPDQIFDGEAEIDRFGSAIYPVGDLNEDGRADFAILAENAAVGHGILYFYYGGWETPFYEMTGEASGDRYGYGFAALGDMNGDKTKDMVVGAGWNDAGGEGTGRVYILSFPN